MALSQEQVNSIYKRVLDLIASELETGELQAWEASEIAEYLLANIDKFEGSEYQFLESLAILWPPLDVLLEENKSQMQEKAEEEISEGALELIRHGKVDEALELTKGATEN